MFFAITQTYGAQPENITRTDSPFFTSSDTLFLSVLSLGEKYTFSTSSLSLTLFSFVSVSLVFSPAITFSFCVLNSPSWIPAFLRTVFTLLCTCIRPSAMIFSFFLNSSGISIIAIDPTTSKEVLSIESCFSVSFLFRTSLSFTLSPSRLQRPL